LEKPRILFISFLDFKDKSIQVIRKTPEYYRDNNWDVHYIVLRDVSLADNYAYEKVINPENINVYRATLPLSKIINLFLGHRLLRRLIQKISYTLGYIKAIYLIKKNKLDKLHFDIIYGYEVHGINTLKILKIFRWFKNSKTIFRYQGSFMLDYIETKKISKIISNLDHLIALKSKPNLAIMTNDGTRGDKLWQVINGTDENLRFWPNGVDIPTIEANPFRNDYDDSTLKFLTVSRLNQWKRVDRAIKLIYELSKTYKLPIKLIVVGDGPKMNELKVLVENLKIPNLVEFKGSIAASNVKYFLDIANIFLSFYEGSNLGNPILEAIRMNKLIVTLNNGTTGDYISHNLNGLIYNEDQLNFKIIASDIIKLINDRERLALLKSNLKLTEDENYGLGVSVSLKK